MFHSLFSSILLNTTSFSILLKTTRICKNFLKITDQCLFRTFFTANQIHLKVFQWFFIINWIVRVSVLKYLFIFQLFEKSTLFLMLVLHNKISVYFSDPTLIAFLDDSLYIPTKSNQFQMFTLLLFSPKGHRILVIQDMNRSVWF